MSRLARLLVPALATTVAPIAAPALSAPANAACSGAVITAGVNPTNSTVKYANSECDGISLNQYGNIDYARGQYYKDGTWQTSSIGWVYIKGNNHLIIGNTVTGRAIRAEAYSARQSFLMVF